MTNLPQGEAPQPEEEAAEPEPEVVGIKITFVGSTLAMNIDTTGIVGNAHLWAASALLARVADQMWDDSRNAALQRAFQQQREIQAVAAAMKGGLVVPGRKS